MKPSYLLLRITALSLAMLAMPSMAQQKMLHCWQNEKGVRTCSDSLPSDAVNRARQELSVGGTTRSRIDRALTPEEQAAAALELARLEAEKAEAITRQQTDRAMLLTYASEDQLRRVFNERVGLAENNIQTASYNVLSLRDALSTQLFAISDLELAGRPINGEKLEQIRQHHDELLAQLHLKTAFEEQRQSLDEEIEKTLAHYRKLKGGGSDTDTDETEEG